MVGNILKWSQRFWLPGIHALPSIKEKLVKMMEFLSHNYVTSQRRRDFSDVVTVTNWLSVITKVTYPVDLTSSDECNPLLKKRFKDWKRLWRGQCGKKLNSWPLEAESSCERENGSLSLTITRNWNGKRIFKASLEFQQRIQPSRYLDHKALQDSR